MKLPLFVGTGVVAADPFTLNAIDFDGSTEFMANTTTQSIGVSNTFTIGTWIKPSAIVGVDFICHIDSNAFAAEDGELTIGLSSGKIFTKLVGGGLANKQYTAATTLSTGTIYYVEIKWDGTTLDIFLNGAADTPYVKSVDNSITVAGPNRTVQIGADAGHTSSVLFHGEISRMAIWDSVIGASESISLYNSGDGYQLDVRNSFGDYTSTSNLKHQWALGKDTGTDIGKDYVSSGAINVSNNSSNITDADIVTF